jgi:hypothetical protein
MAGSPAGQPRWVLVLSALIAKARKVVDQSSAILHEPMSINKIYPIAVRGIPARVHEPAQMPANRRKGCLRSQWKFTLQCLARKTNF